MKFAFEAKTVSIVGAAAFATLVVAAAPAAADPGPPPPPFPVPAPLVAELAPPPGEAATQPLAAEVPAQPLAAGPADPAVEGVPHLVSPENLPPGTSTTPQSQTRLSYIRDLWHAMQTQEVSGSDALLLLTQRPLSSSPSTGLPAGPQAPLPGEPLSAAPLPVEPPSGEALPVDPMSVVAAPQVAPPMP